MDGSHPFSFDGSPSLPFVPLNLRLFLLNSSRLSIFVDNVVHGSLLPSLFLLLSPQLTLLVGYGLLLLHKGLPLRFFPSLLLSHHLFDQIKLLFDHLLVLNHLVVHSLLLLLLDFDNLSVSGLNPQKHLQVPFSFAEHPLLSDF